MNPIAPQLLPQPPPIDTRSSPGASSAASPAAPTRIFAETLRATSMPASPTSPISPTSVDPAASAPSATGLVRNVLQNVAAGHREMDRIIKMAQSGRSFSSAQLIGLQARVFRLSTEIDLASKLLEKVTSGVKQTMSTQV